MCIRDRKDAAFLDNARFRQIQGRGESQILTADGSPVYVRLYKKDAVEDVYKRQDVDASLRERDGFSFPSQSALGRG